MKKIIFSFFALILTMTSVQAMASGKITLQNNFFQDNVNGGHDYRPMIGVQVYEFLIGKKVAVNSWTGYGVQPLELKSDVEWFTTKNQLDFFVGRFTVSPGLQYAWIPTYNEHRLNPYLKLDWKLW